MSATTSGDLAALAASDLPVASTEVLATPAGTPSATPMGAAFIAAMGDADVGASLEEAASTQERPRNPDGTFAAKASESPVEGEEIAAEAIPQADGDPAPDAEPEAEAPAVEPITLIDRNGKEVVVEVSDPEVAEVIRAAKNDGMRKAEFTRRMEGVEKQERDFREFKALLSTPEALVQQIPADAQLRMLNYLLATNLDNPEVRGRLEQWYGDDVSRREALLGMKEQVTSANAQVRQQMAEGDRVNAIQRAIDAQIPDTAQPDDAKDFFTAAAAHLGAVESQRGTPLSPDEVAPLLDRFRTRFGFNSPASPVAASPPSLVPTTPAAAVPATATAEALVKKATANAQRMKALPTQQAAAQKIAPQSAGAAPAVAPRPKSIEEAGSNFITRMKAAEFAGSR